ncbi:MAG TPA: hypothetical protein VJM33_11105 [Microthrixaceae bacterium]|nr:hypothetical protein [Microthrixaceae bacterium]
MGPRPTLPYLTSPLAEAIEEGLDAATAWIKGPGERLRTAAGVMEQPGFNANAAVRESGMLGIELSNAMLVTGVSFIDAIAGLADPPDRYEEHKFRWPNPPLVVLSDPPLSTQIVCDSCTSLSPFEINDISNPSLTGVVTSAVSSGGPGSAIDIVLRVNPVPATPQFTAKLRLPAVSGPPGVAAFVLGWDTRQHP